MMESSLDARTCIRIFVAALLAVGISFWSFTCSVRAEQTDEELSPAENWVLERVKAGEVADLEERFPDEEARELSADFIQELLAGKLKDVPIHRHGVRIKHARITETLDLVNAEVPDDVWLEHCQFDSRVDLSMSHFRRVLSFRHSRFREADFIGMEVRYALFENTVFEGAADFRYTQIGGNFQANEARFNSAKAEAAFDNMTVGGTAKFEWAVFEGPADFSYAQIGGNFEANNMQFTNREKAAYFHRMTVGDTAFFVTAVFTGTADFSYAQIGGNFEANNMQFTNREKAAYFHRMTVGDTAFFVTAVFTGTADFSHAQITGNFQANGARFNNTKTEAVFGSMTVGGAAKFKEARFEGPVDFSYAQIGGNFEANEARFNNTETEADFDSMTVGGKALFQEAVFAGRVDFSYAEFMSIDIQAESWPAESDSVILSGMTYKHISAGPEEDNAWRRLLEWVDGSAYSVQPYVQLEAFFQAEGYPERADEVFVARKRRERKEALGGLSAWWNAFLECFVLYGRSPERALCWSGLVVFLFGFPLFRRREDMEPQKPEDASRPYCPFWYSLDLFLPINLQMANVWRPRQDRRFAPHYARLHIILGWVLTTIGLAAVMGIIK
jgi:uncharacterized protein YjbI with pentapeptide repeats